MKPIALVGTSLALFGCALALRAQPPAPPSAAPAAPAAPAAGPPAPVRPNNPVPRDPKGVRGISPFREALKRGDAAFVAQNFDAAIAAYGEAIAGEPQNALGHYRLGEAHLAKGELDRAEAAWQEALRLAAGDATLRAKVLFVLADLRERQKQYEAATPAWDEYAKAAAVPNSRAYPASAVERKQRIDVWTKLTLAYAEVKQRIAKRLQEADDTARSNAK